MNVREVFATNVRRFRDAHGLSQEQLAQLANVDRTQISRAENRHNVTLNTIERIAAAFGTDPAILLLENAAIPEKTADNEDLPEDLFALVQWSEGAAIIRKLDTYYDDLTIKVLVDLIERGHQGDNLVRAYNDTSSAVAEFLRNR